ncbi:hypothetical protein DFH09DRAFT_1248600 [Mycena vulgaris]|nr:hypothetical protein DFH09DRAFT_1248600 [Mycena vulgaris]
MAPSVLIAGAGPSGLILALVLLQTGVSVRIIDKEPHHKIGSRGSGVQPRTLELCDILGILPDLEKEGEYMLSRAIYKPGEIEPSRISPIVEWLEPTPDVPHANPLAISQERHEEILRDHLQKLSCAVELGSELRSFEQFPDHIVANIVKTGTNGEQLEESTKFDWLAGMDGARSVVRKQLGLSFLGETREYKVFMFAYTGRPEHLAEKTLTREEFIQEFYEVTGRRDVKFGPATWVTNWRPNLRMVDTMRSGRVFIGGDAAHCHSPTGGQGLNSSVQDAANVGWKLALVQKGLAPATLLDTYTEERIRFIAQMLKLTTELYAKSVDQLQESKPADDSAWKRDGDLRMLGVNYCGSSIVLEDTAVAGNANDAYSKAAGRSVQAAYRAPDAPGLVRAGSGDAPTTLFTVFRVSVHTALLFGGDASARAPGQTGSDDSALFYRAGHAYAGYGLMAGELAVVVVRPDGVVGAVVSGPDGLEGYFQKILA